MTSLRDAIDEALTRALANEIGLDGRFDMEGLLHIALPCEIEVGALVDAVLETIREAAT